MVWWEKGQYAEEDKAVRENNGRPSSRRPGKQGTCPRLGFRCCLGSTVLVPENGAVGISLF